ncbi:hypothetical protein [Lacihabitans soyangensis]|uniref:Uncharacterized protein n=1 Tax=Lacihabitans soyangensis TaxID=869394 RepID=A0AAE3GY73_9BACT|nr:hypothetical protein [Lacihabitans soyangensis]MCP9761464.1 hypothetical protein [Lacihabitans soyangensis]
MKKLILAIFSLGTFATSAQQNEEKPLKIFKFQPFSLVTGSMNFGEEIFNKSRTRSTVIGLGIRYINRKNDIYDSYGTISAYKQNSKWQGATFSVERRFYVPGFFSGDKYSFINDKSKFGVYLSPGLKVEYNVNDYDKGGFYYLTDSTKPNNMVSKFYRNSGRISYLGLLPNMNIGLQYTIFQNLYIDTYIGGGIRFLSQKKSKEVKDTVPQNGNFTGYYGGNENGALTTFVIREGVQPNFGFALGLNF